MKVFNIQKSALLNLMIPVDSFTGRESPDREKGVSITFHLSVLSDIFPESGKIVLNKYFLNPYFQ